MTEPASQDKQLDPPEARWPAVITVLAVGGIYTALPGSLAIGPRWLLPMIVVGLLIPTILTHRRGQHAANQMLGHTLAVVITLFMVWSLVLLVHAVPSHREPPVIMLRSAAALWVTNVLVFAFWYWRLDAGGPHGRDLRLGHDTGAFLFPQMTLHQTTRKAGHGGQPWSPDFIDYLFLAFNTSTAFSPTDTPVLSRWAKVLTMIQATISLTVVVVLAARAVNIL
ncbi:MAG TPA: hypothetical protein VG269_05775 [Tepidisphaeraceae bacterium]|nr:hypothetical protein [Tepidisphaeraceae bacterium]